MDKMYMNRISGDVQSLDEWKADHRSADWDEQTWEDWKAGLVEVKRGPDGEWVEA